MKNKEYYIQTLNECAKNKFSCDEGPKSNFNQLKKLYKNILKSDGKYFKILSDLDFLKGDEKKEAKLVDFLNIVGVVFSTYKLLGIDTQIKGYLKEKYGLSVEEISEGFINKTMNKQIEKNEELEEIWGRCTTGRQFPKDVKEFLNGSLKEALGLRTLIHEVESNIKETEAPKIEENCAVGKSNFIKTISLKVKEIKKGKDEVVEDIRKINEENTNLREAIQPIFGEIND